MNEEQDSGFYFNIFEYQTYYYNKSTQELLFQDGIIIRAISVFERTPATTAQIGEFVTEIAKTEASLVEFAKDKGEIEVGDVISITDIYDAEWVVIVGEFYEGKIIGVGVATGSGRLHNPFYGSLEYTKRVTKASKEETKILEDYGYISRSGKIYKLID